MVVTVFRSRLQPEYAAAYYEMATQMRALAEGMPGFISFKTFRAEDGGSACLSSSLSPRRRCGRGGSTPNTGRPRSWGAWLSTQSCRSRCAPSPSSTNLSARTPNQPQLSSSVDMICIATACAKRTCKLWLLTQALSKSSDFLICTPGKS
jgi:hypothetical protein